MSLHPPAARFVATSRGGILYDASRLCKPGDELFERDHWRAKGALEEMAGGRGSIAVLRVEPQRWVLRHYRRGGWAAKVSRDRYWWLGEARTRSFAEWRLLAELRRRNLPVPTPLAARYVRSALTYQADLITAHLPPARTLADSITGTTLAQEQWRTIGRTLAAFHREGVHHADLNAGNILLSTDPRLQQDSHRPQDSRLPQDPDAVAPVYLLDFDRGRIRPRGSWESEVLARLKRSLEKTRRQRQDARFGDGEWQWLMEGYGEEGSDQGPGTSGL